MQKVLIISYFFPPANFVGAERTGAMAKYLHKNGVYPIIVTRQWNDGQTDIIDRVIQNEYVYEKHDNYEVHRMPYQYSLRDRCAKKKWLKPLRKILTLWELIWSNYFVLALPYSNLYSQACKILRNDDEIKVVVASGRPFQSFFIGYKLKKEFDISWIPDYRDEWSTRATSKPTSIINRLLFSLEKNRERKWASNADFFISVSKMWVESIENHIGKKGIVIKNGFENPINSNKTSIADISSDNGLTILYLGTIYPYQPIEIFIDAIKSLSEENQKQVKVIFLGSFTLLSEEIRLKKLTANIKAKIEFSPRINKEEMNNFIQQSDIAFATSYGDLKGCIPVKLYDYFANDLPVLLVPSDGGIMEEFIHKTSSGFIANSVQECSELLISCINEKKRGGKIQLSFNYEEGNKYSRAYQINIFGKKIRSLDL